MKRGGKNGSSSAKEFLPELEDAAENVSAVPRRSFWPRKDVILAMRQVVFW